MIKRIGIDISDYFTQLVSAKPIHHGQPGILHPRAGQRNARPAARANGDLDMIRAQTGAGHSLLAEAACHDARDLTEGGNTAYIVLDGQTYTLRITRAGKLILTK